MALVVTGRVAAEIDGMRRALGARSLLRIPPHVTLVPPVNVPAAEEAAVLEVVRAAAAVVAPVAVELGPPATFLPRNPVVYLAVAGDLASIERLRAALAAGPLAPPVERDELPFVPHVTLDQRIDPARAPAALEALADYRARVTFEEVTLLEQDTTPDRIWHPVGSWALAAPAVVGRGGVEVTLARASRLDPAEARWAGDVLDGEPFAVTARKERVLVGTAAGAIRSGLCELHSLVVDQPARRQGIGSQLVRAVEDIAAGAGCTAVQATVPAGTPAAALLAGRGYRELARLADHLLLARELPTT